jgi:hypothetical protein
VIGGFHAQAQPLQHLHRPFCSRRPIDNGLVIPAGETITLAPGGHPRSIEEVYFRCAANMSSRLIGLGGSLRSTTEVVTAPNRLIASTIGSKQFWLLTACDPDPRE